MGGTEPDFSVTVALAGTGRGTVTGAPGGFSCNNVGGATTGTCQATFSGSTDLTISATAEAGSTFDGWSGNGINCPTSACTVTISSSNTITATFNSVSAATQTLTIVGGGNGTGSGSILSDPEGIDCTITDGTADGPACSAPFASGASVLLRCNPALWWRGAAPATGRPARW